MKITQQELYNFITEPYLSRGTPYFKEGLLEFIFITPHEASAWVLGSRAYKVSLKYGTHGIEGDCTCPAFGETGVCKHLAALGFSLIQHYAEGYVPSREYFERISFFRCR